MKKFLLKVSILSLYVLLLKIVFPIIVDPFNVFHVYNIRATGTEPNRHYIKMTYILDNPDKFSGYLFGSSRVGAIHTNKIPGKIYNMTYSVGLPAEHLANLKTFATNNIRPSKVFIGLDSIAITVDPSSHITQAMRCPYEYLTSGHFFYLFFDVKTVFDSLRIKPKASDADSLKVFYSYGWQYDYGMESVFDWDNDKYVPVKDSGIYEKSAKRALREVREIVDFCHENRIELVFFTNPMYKTTYMNALDVHYLDFLEGIAEFSEFYNFSSFNNITMNNKNYLDTSHYKAEVGDLILNVICSGEIYPELYAQGFGVKVTKDNAKGFISALREQAQEFVK